MMSIKVLLFLGLAALACVEARVARDAPQPAELPTSFTEFFEAAGKSWKELEAAISKAFGTKDRAELEQKVIDQGKEYSKKLDEWALDVKKQTDEIQQSELVKDLRGTIDNAIENWKVNNPNNTEELLEKANKGIQQIISKLKQIGESEEANQIKELSAKLLESSTNTFKEVAKDIAENVKTN